MAEQSFDLQHSQVCDKQQSYTGLPPTPHIPCPPTSGCSSVQICESHVEEDPHGFSPGEQDQIG